MLLLEKNRKTEKTEKTGGKLRKIGILLKSNHTYTNHVLAFTHEKLKRVCLKFDGALFHEF